MKKALAQNPNMLRTMIGLGLTLILILSYAVYSATIDSAYYYYHTTNEEVEPEVTDQGLSESNTTQTWTFTTTLPTTWMNVSFIELKEGDILTLSVSDGEWYHHEMLGSDEAETFSCIEVDDGYEESNICSKSQSHSLDVLETGSVIFRGIVSPNLPISGLGSLYADSLEEAENKSLDLINEHSGTRIWTITVESDSEINAVALVPEVEFTQHELTKVEPFTVDPVTEMIWSVAALVGCFGMVLIIPLIAYVASLAKERKENREREEAVQNNP
ncbi:MAG: hypothetical protein QF440_04650 [Candidatus Thalassarchaeaceae archaeon]|nr:hypothetical protein [Candidatus Thalassarchaeaceae archaeon]